MAALNTVFRQIAKQSDRMNDVAGGILAVIRNQRIKSLEQFDAAVYDAYDRNGWNYKRGRPVAGEQVGEPVPEAVRTYVAETRAAYREGLNVAGFDSMYALRQGVREARRPTVVELRPAPFPELQGVVVADEDHLTGALVHDLAVIYEHAPVRVRGQMKRRLAELLDEFAPTVAKRLAG